MNILEDIKEYKQNYIAWLIVAALTLYGFLQFDKVKKKGIITICYVKYFEIQSQGSTTYCTVFLNGKKYDATSSEGCKEMNGKYFFVKVLKNNPTYYILIYQNNEVPQCILENKLPDGGWDSIPNCK